MIIRLILCAFLAGLIVGAAICSRAHAAEVQRTPAMIAACTPDAVRLCPRDIPAAMVGNYDAVVACMKRHRAQLSQECRGTLK